MLHSRNSHVQAAATGRHLIFPFLYEIILYENLLFEQLLHLILKLNVTLRELQDVEAQNLLKNYVITFLENMTGFVLDRMQDAGQVAMDILARKMGKGLLNLIAGLDKVLAERS